MSKQLKSQGIAILSLAIVGLIGIAASAPPSFAGKFADNHPRRAEVLHRDNNINGRLNKDYGTLGGHYGQLEHRDQQIHNQERRDKNANGGYITKGQQRHLNGEENRLNGRIGADKE
jgi:hypothetical protein